MLIDKDELIVFLLQNYYKLYLEHEKFGDNELEKYYLKGMLDIIEEVNKFGRNE
ncbi:hypothetical protein ABG79_00289 [Caloramator mitchellensis]|uniref:Uncharacterized protein n=1 Tax=Caloramator mitchellensis TaxID=908809 RepID=A0A0R3JX40_CALMK|nr:hypothetical protein [Caloramator mitchellensis]KRQ88121.1 hypothetical protein ABG79_00289 [Caloramator mitchellensis]